MRISNILIQIALVLKNANVYHTEYLAQQQTLDIVIEDIQRVIRDETRDNNISSIFRAVVYGTTPIGEFSRALAADFNSTVSTNNDINIRNADIYEDLARHFPISGRV